MNFHRMEATHRHRALRRFNDSVGINHDGLLVDVAPEVYVSLLLREVEFLKDARILSFERLLHAGRGFCRIHKAAALVFDNRLYVRTEYLDDAFLSGWMFSGDDLAEECLPDGSRAERPENLDGLYRAIRAVDDIEKMRLDDGFGNRLKVGLHILERIAHILAECISRKRLKHFLKKRTRALEESADNLSLR